MKYALIMFCALTVSACQMKEKSALKKPEGPPAAQKTNTSVKTVVKKQLSSKVSSSKTTKKASPAKKERRVSTSSGKAKKRAALGKKARAGAKKKAKWPTNIIWQTWEEGRQKAAEQGKPICLVIYADWCPRCRELAPIFGTTKIAELAKKFVMIRQDQDKRPDWLGTYQDHGRYVPRVFFFGMDGQLRTDVTSGHPRYPFFYSSRNLSALARSMSRASKG